MYSEDYNEKYLESSSSETNDSILYYENIEIDKGYTIYKRKQESNLTLLQ